MIAAVIADDLTGAAELASAAADLGFSAEVHTAVDPTSTAEIVCLDTNSRDLSPDQAAEVVTRAIDQILPLNPACLYKKTDSVLRGNVRSEIETILRTARLDSSLLVPANPSKSRVICDGTYYVDGVPLSQTAFAKDPHHPRTTSDIRALLGTSDSGVHIQTPDAASPADLDDHAAALTPRMLPAGGVDFFRAVLQARTTPRSVTTTPALISPPVLFCCGSLQGWCDNSSDEFRQHEIPVIPIPEELNKPATVSDDALDRWGGTVSEILTRAPAAALSLGDSCATPPETLTTHLSRAVSNVLRRTNISTLVIEGGSTASAILHALRFTRLEALPTSALPGVAALRPTHVSVPSILLKPGSYPWPAALWHFQIANRRSQF
jgi:D-threonate/D-erythronate kinase